MLRLSWAKMYRRAKKDGARRSISVVPKLQGDGIKYGPAESRLVSVVAQRQVDGRVDVLVCSGRMTTSSAMCVAVAFLFFVSVTTAFSATGKSMRNQEQLS